MTSRIVNARRWAAAAVGALGVASVAAAEISHEIFVIRASSSLGSGVGTWTVDDGMFEPDGSFTWWLDQPYDIRSAGGQVIATLSTAFLSLQADPVVALSFEVTAGAADTVFTIDSALLSFPAFGSAEGRARAGVDVSDLNGNGVTLTGGFAGGKAYRSAYNGPVGAGTTFATLIDTPVAGGPFSGSGADEEFPGPPPAFSPIAGLVSDMHAQYSFTLSARDAAAGTSVYVIIPSPAGLALLGTGLLVLGRRRR